MFGGSEMRMFSFPKANKVANKEVIQKYKGNKI